MCHEVNTIVVMHCQMWQFLRCFPVNLWTAAKSFSWKWGLGKGLLAALMKSWNSGKAVYYRSQTIALTLKTMELLHIGILSERGLLIAATLSAHKGFVWGLYLERSQTVANSYSFKTLTKRAIHNFPCCFAQTKLHVAPGPSRVRVCCPQLADGFVHQSFLRIQDTCLPGLPHRTLRQHRGYPPLTCSFHWPPLT